MGKEEIALYEQFLLFPQCFQKLSVVDTLKRVSMEERVNTCILTFLPENDSVPQCGCFGFKHIILNGKCVLNLFPNNKF